VNREERRRKKKLLKKNSSGKANGSLDLLTAQPAVERGVSFQESGRLDEAILCYKEALISAPQNLVALVNLSLILAKQKNFIDAKELLERAVSIKPDLTVAHNNLGNVYKCMGDEDGAVKCFKKAISIEPNSAMAHYNLGNSLKIQGNLDEAVLSYKNALSIKPDYAEAHFNLSTLRKCSDYGDIKSIKMTLAGNINIEKRVILNFALSKSLSDMQENSQSFDALLKGNRLHRNTIKFKISDEERVFGKFVETFDESFFKAREGYGIDDNMPIFIVGMPRSGSTLIEQILSAHPDVYGAGELIILPEQLKKLSSDQPEQVPAKIAAMKLQAITTMADEYITEVRKLSADSRFVSDKMPINFLHIGIIKLLLPNAKIIHSVRSCEDTCFSIFKTKFTGMHNYAYDLSELGQYYRLYHQLMEHWHRLFPDDIYDVVYEKITAEQESETRKLLDFCGIGWDDKCMQFHKSKRSVATASNVQVRQPMYRSSVGGWRRFEQQLQPLIDALGDLSVSGVA
jgi:tetratricopeptide (TPR) repeat protein